MSLRGNCRIGLINNAPSNQQMELPRAMRIAATAIGPLSRLGALVLSRSNGTEGPRLDSRHSTHVRDNLTAAPPG